MKASLQSQHSSSILIYRIANIITNLFQTSYKLIQIVFNTTSYIACPSSQRKENKHATTHVAKVDTVLSPKLGVTQEGHCQPGTDSTPRTSHMEQKLAMHNYPGGSRRSYLKNSLARLSMLILSKAYPGLGYTLPITKLMKA
jgi:hypothetical protein